MKKLLCLLILISSVAFGQSSFPMRVTNNIDRIQRIIMEGVPIDGTYVNNGYTFTGTETPESNGTVYTDNFAGLSYRSPISRCTLVTGMNLWASAEVSYIATFGYANAGERGVVGTGGRTINTNNAIVRPKEFVGAGSNHSLIRPVSPANKYILDGSWQGYKFSADMNWNAKSSIYFIGDSNLEGTAIATDPYSRNYEDLWSWKIRAQYKKWGNDVRNIDKSLSGENSGFYESLRQAGKLDLPEPPALIFYALGTNHDATLSDFGGNVTKFLNWAIVEWPNAKIVVIAPVPTQSDETAMALQRTAAQLAVTTLNNPKVIFINAGLAFNPSDYSQYSGTEADGVAIHLGVVGHTSVANYIINQINTVYPSFKVL